jgi:hypothetical protein
MEELEPRGRPEAGVEEAGPEPGEAQGSECYSQSCLSRRQRTEVWGPPALLGTSVDQASPKEAVSAPALTRQTGKETQQLHAAPNPACDPGQWQDTG